MLAFAQPANNNCGGAILLSVNPTCTPTPGTTTGATQSQAGCSGTADDDVWYSFVATGPSVGVTVSGNAGFDPVLQAFSGTCGGSSLGCADNTGNAGTESLTLNNLFTGITYWVRVYHKGTGSGSGSFNICVHDPIVEPACNPFSPEPANTMNDCLAIPKICQVNGFCGTTAGYHATPSATNLTAYTPNFWAQLNTAFCGSIENNAFCKFKANASNVQLRVYGGCATGTGIQLMVFSLNAPSPGTCNNGPITTYGCQYLNLTAAGSGGSPISFTGMTPGTTYYLMIDGFAGAICDYKIGADYGVQLSTTVSPSNKTICLGSSVNLSASGGDGNYTWDVSPDLSTLVGPSVTATPTNLGMNTYVVSSTATDPECPNTGDTAFINVTTTPTPEAGIPDSVCFGETIYLDGAISNSSNTTLWQFQAGGISPNPTVQFQPNFSVANPQVTVDQPGVYKFILRETSQLCGQYRDTVEVTVIDPTNAFVPTEPSCMGQNNGTIEVNNQYADEYSFDNGQTWQASNIGTGFASGTYVVCSQNYLGCSSCDTVVVPDGPEIAMSVSSDTLICENGSATLQAVGTGGSSFTYVWGHTASTLGTQVVSPTASTYYNVHTVNQGGCISNTDSIYVELRNPITVTVSADTNVCPGETVYMRASASDGNGGPYVFNWSHGPSATGGNSIQPYVPTNDETIQVSVTDACESSMQTGAIELGLHEVPEPTFEAADMALCEPAMFDLVNTTDPAMVANSFWEITDGTFYENQNQILTSVLPAGQYGVQLTVISPDGCIGTTNIPAYLQSLKKPKAQFNFSPSPVTMFNTEVKMGNFSADADYYEWEFENGSPAYSEEANPTTTFPEGVVDNYRVRLFAISEEGCLDTLDKIVEVQSEKIIYVPTSFTPNGDLYNNKWEMHMAGLVPQSFHLQVFNRWGQLVFESFDIENFWDGTYKGRVVPEGMYQYNIEAEDAITAEKYSWSGHVTVLK